MSNAWVAQAACKGTGPTPFFPAHGATADAARALCGRCPVAAECLGYAARHNIRDGIWGGLEPHERRHDRQCPGCGTDLEARCHLCGPCRAIRRAETHRTSRAARRKRAVA